MLTCFRTNFSITKPARETADDEEDAEESDEPEETLRVAQLPKADQTPTKRKHKSTKNTAKNSKGAFVPIKSVLSVRFPTDGSNNYRMYLYLLRFAYRMKSILTDSPTPPKSSLAAQIRSAR